jgi:hypothetical protein
MVAIRLADAVGHKNVLAAARRLGVRSKLEDYRSLALGAQEVTPIELTAAYGAMASGGYRVVIAGANFGAAPAWGANGTSAYGIGAYPKALPLPEGSLPPFKALRVNWGPAAPGASPTSPDSRLGACISSSYTPPDGTERAPTSLSALIDLPDVPLDAAVRSYLPSLELGRRRLGRACAHARGTADVGGRARERDAARDSAGRFGSRGERALRRVNGAPAAAAGRAGRARLHALDAGPPALPRRAPRRAPRRDHPHRGSNEARPRTLDRAHPEY